MKAARAPGLLTPWRWLDLALFFAAAIVVIAMAFRVRVYYKVRESPAIETVGPLSGESDTNRVA